MCLNFSETHSPDRMKFSTINIKKDRSNLSEVKAFLNDDIKVNHITSGK